MNQETSSCSVAVVGAGISGLCAAKHLSDAGHDVHVFDKSRGPGGRMSTRRQDGHEFDHGTQYFTIRDKEFRDAVELWRARGLIETWPGRIVNITNGVARGDHKTLERFVPVPRMNALCRDLSDALNVTFETRVSKIEGNKGAWNITINGQKKSGPFDSIVVTPPPEQAVEILAGAAPGLIHQIAPADMLPCWTVMVVFEERIDVEWDGAFVFESPLSWVARNNSKPGRMEAETWVIHGSPEWSEAHIETDPATVGKELITAFFEATGASRISPTFKNIHRWRFAKTKKPLNTGYLYDSELGIGVCGDWCRGDRVEDAFVSGLALAKRITGSMAP